MAKPRKRSLRFGLKRDYEIFSKKRKPFQISIFQVDDFCCIIFYKCKIYRLQQALLIGPELYFAWISSRK